LNQTANLNYLKLVVDLLERNCAPIDPSHRWLVVTDWWSWIAWLRCVGCKANGWLHWDLSINRSMVFESQMNRFLCFLSIVSGQTSTMAFVEPNVCLFTCQQRYIRYNTCTIIGPSFVCRVNTSSIASLQLICHSIPFHSNSLWVNWQIRSIDWSIDWSKTSNKRWITNE
jgi:hypothetical protein